MTITTITIDLILVNYSITGIYIIVIIKDVEKWKTFLKH